MAWRGVAGLRNTAGATAAKSAQAVLYAGVALSPRHFPPAITPPRPRERGDHARRPRRPPLSLAALAGRTFPLRSFASASACVRSRWAAGVHRRGRREPHPHRLLTRPRAPPTAHTAAHSVHLSIVHCDGSEDALFPPSCPLALLRCNTGSGYLFVVGQCTSHLQL